MLWLRRIKLLDLLCKTVDNFLSYKLRLKWHCAVQWALAAGSSILAGKRQSAIAGPSRISPKVVPVELRGSRLSLGRLPLLPSPLDFTAVVHINLK